LIKINIEFILQIFNPIATIILLLTLNTNFLCDQSDLNLTIRNNINGDFSEIKELKELKPGAFINLDWEKKNLMLPYSPRPQFVSFSDKKWDWRYLLTDDGKVNELEPLLYELSPSGQYIEHKCKISNK
tara:strand:- start:45 stop:431 length:387 start_codon:yes stop_codon:yes gene_type:complete